MNFACEQVMANHTILIFSSTEPIVTVGTPLVVVVVQLLGSRRRWRVAGRPASRVEGWASYTCTNWTVGILFLLIIIMGKVGRGGGGSRAIPASNAHQVYYQSPWAESVAST